jgi:predicted dehydrogenase
MAMIGGGKGSLIGPVHKMASTLDSMISLVAGSFSSDPGITRETGEIFRLDPSRVYDTWQEMIEKENSRKGADRINIIAIATPNHQHHEQVMAALNAGFHVVCDKPLAVSVAQAREIRDKVKETGLMFCFTHNYTGYPMVAKAREMVESGSLGVIRKVAMEYFQGWMTTRVEDTDNRQAGWRSDPAKAGIAGCMADIGTHAFNMAEYITGSRVESVLARLNKVVEGRKLEDDGAVIADMDNGAVMTLLASQIATGEENNLVARVYGTLGGIEWHQQEPNTLIVKWRDRPMEIYRTGTGFSTLGEVAPLYTRLPSGHPEGFIEAFANIYHNFALHLTAHIEGKEHDSRRIYPGIEEGVRGMQFLEAIVKSSAEQRVVTL